MNCFKFRVVRKTLQCIITDGILLLVLFKLLFVLIYRLPWKRHSVTKELGWLLHNTLAAYDRNETWSLKPPFLMFLKVFFISFFWAFFVTGTERVADWRQSHVV